MPEIIYKEFSSNRWNFWTYVDGQRIFISERRAAALIRDGARLVVVK
jgi:hypothetical protein